MEKLLREIDALQRRQPDTLDRGQLEKIGRRPTLESRLAELRIGPPEDARPARRAAPGPAAGAALSPTSAPDGLTVAYLEEELASTALDELAPHFSGRGRARTTSSMFEVGWSFLAADQGRIDPAKPTAQFPRLLQLLAAAMRTLTGGEDLCEERLNVICRHYAEGQGIPMHVDRRELFDEDVYGCVLLNSSGGGLEFQQTRRSGEVLRSFRLDERPGACFRQRGEARYKWSHGVEPLAFGERISVTWRWLAPEHLSKPGAAAVGGPASSRQPPRR